VRVVDVTDHTSNDLECIVDASYRVLGAQLVTCGPARLHPYSNAISGRSQCARQNVPLLVSSSHFECVIYNECPHAYFLD
jgi:hypothetical protein